MTAQVPDQSEHYIAPEFHPATFHPATSWQGRALARGARHFVKPLVSRVRLTPRVMRFSQLGFDAVTLALPVHTDVHVAPANEGGVPGEWVMGGRDLIAGRVLLYCHGGAYFFGSPRSHRALTWRLSRACRARVLALDYRQPPKWRYPAPLEDAVTAYRSLLDRGYRPENILLGGDSAGGNLVLVTLIRLRELGLPMPAAGILISPWADLSASGVSLTDNADHDPLIPVNLLRFVAKTYCAGHDPRSPLFSPAWADLTGLPPLLVQVGSTEVLRSDAEAVVARARDSGVQCHYQVWENMMHVFQALAGWLPEASLAVREIGAFARESVAQAGGEVTQVAGARLVHTGGHS